jgi:DNA-binding response OmpR family regulator
LELPVKILIVDDDDVYRELLKDAIEELGVEVDLSADGIQAVEKLQVAPFDILVTDLNMPRMDGLKLLTYARHLYPSILTIIITGYGSLESAIEAIREGAYDYVQKPFKIEQITVVARNAIEKVKILRDKAKLLKELELAYRKLHLLERESDAKQSDGEIALLESTGDNTYFLFPRQSLPLYLLESRIENADHTLTKLERLKELKKEGVISESEFSLLKKSIINSLGPTHS